MAEITHEDLMRAVDRIEASHRREVDNLRIDVKDDMKQVHARVSELRDQFKAQNGRVTTGEGKLAELDRQVTAVRHDVAGFHTALATLRLLVERGAARVGVAPPDETQKGSKGFIAGAVAVILLLVGVASHVFEAAAAVGPLLLKLVKP